MRSVMVAATCLALAGSVSASEVPNGSQWSGGGGSETVTVDVGTDLHSDDAVVAYRDGNGCSAAVRGDQGPNSTPNNPTATEAPASSTPGPSGETYRIRGGKVQRKGADGIWRNMVRKKKTQKVQR